MTQAEAILEAFHLHGGQMSLRQIIKYSWAWEFRARKAEINRDHPSHQIRHIKGTHTGLKSDHLYVLEKKPKPGELL
jgi:hypothetical protein